MTYSLVIRDAATRQFGVAVQSHYFSVGSVVPWAHPGVGAVATQAFAEITYGPKGLERMAAGASAPDALAVLLAEDEGSAMRQVAMVDAEGRAAAHTGDRCIADASHIVGDGWTVEANMMRNGGVPEAMADAVVAHADAPLADRLLAALDAAEAAGGDIRGKQSAAMLVVPADGEPWRRALDLRVEDSTEPLREMRRLLGLKKAYSQEGDIDVLGDNHEIRFWLMVGTAASGDIDKAREMLGAAIKVEPGWAELARRLPSSGLWPGTDEQLEQLLA